MSWLKENYDKAALGGAAVITLAVVALIFTGGSGEVSKVKKAKRDNTFEIKAKANLVEIEEVLGSHSTPEYLEHSSTDVYSFIAYPVYGIRDKVGVHELDPETVIQGAPLKWWREHDINDFKFEGADKKDSDEDGFSNIEEFIAGTNPRVSNSHPNLVEKLTFIGARPTSYRMEWSKVDDERASMNFRSRRGTQDICKVGDTFPTKGQPEQFLNRFKVKSLGEGVNPTNNVKDTFYEIEDTKKIGVVYKIWRSDGPLKSKDWTAEFRLDTPGGGESFEVNEGGEFSLPFTDGGAGYSFVFDPKRESKAQLEKLEIKFGNEVKVLGLSKPE